MCWGTCAGKDCTRFWNGSFDAGEIHPRHTAGRRFRERIRKHSGRGRFESCAGIQAGMQRPPNLLTVFTCQG